MSMERATLSLSLSLSLRASSLALLMNPESEAIIGEIIQRVQQLSASERRVLQRRLRVSGLVEAEELISDRNRLEIATVLGVQASAMMAQSSTPPEPSLEQSDMLDAYELDSADDYATEELSDATIDNEINPAPESKVAPELDEEITEYRSPVSGKVVVGTPEIATAAKPTPEPHMMPPLPGLAPEHPIRVVFDGGSKGNPGIGYGSYALDWPGLPRQIVQLQFGTHVTNNEAEYDTLIAALEGIADRLTDQEADVSTAQLDIRGDSELVIKQVRGEYKAKNSRMKVRRDRVLELLNEFDDWSLVYHGRVNSVRILGH